MGVSIESLIPRMAELRVVSEVSMRRAYQRLNNMAEFRRDEPVATYPGEVPSLLREALALAESMESRARHLRMSRAGRPRIYAKC